MTEPYLPCKFRRLALAVAAAIAGLALPVHSPAGAAIAANSTDRTSFVLLAPGGSNSVSMSGSTEDLERARSLRAGSEALLYVRHGGGAYVIRDAATLRRVEALFEPQKELGARQAELGSRQAALGQRQGRLGEQQARLGVRQASASSGRAAELGRQQNSLGRQQDALGRQQNELGRQQNELGREQNRLARLAKEKLHALVAEAIQSGVAQRVN